MSSEPDCLCRFLPLAVRNYIYLGLRCSAYLLPDKRDANPLGPSEHPYFFPFLSQDACRNPLGAYPNAGSKKRRLSKWTVLSWAHPKGVRSVTILLFSKAKES
jgi:hypothetical protein